MVEPAKPRGCAETVLKQMARFISLSGGVESTTMCLLYGKGATAIFCDTGDEHGEMYERLDFLETALTSIHEGDFRLVRIKPSPNIKGRTVETLSDGIRAYSFMPGPRSRYCTTRFKIEPIEAFLKEQGECELLIGFNADEEPGTVRVGNMEKLKNVTYRYPLYDDGYDRNDCEALLRSHGLHPNFPIYMSRGGCKFCFFKSKSEYKALYLLDPKTFHEGWELEKSIQDKRKRYFSILPHTTFKAIADEVESELAMWGRDEVLQFYKKSADTKTCGFLCHR